MAFTPWAVFGALFAAGICLALRQRLPAAIALGSGLLLAAIVIPRGIGDTTEEGTSLRVMSANVRLGEADARSLAELAVSKDVDVLSVQELTPEMAGGLEAAGLSETLPHSVLAPGPGSSGGGLYSRQPLAELAEVPGAIAGPLPAAELEVPGAGPVRVYVFHNPPPTGPAAVDEWAADMRSIEPPPAGGPPVIVAGDFNATLDNSEFLEVLDRGYFDAAERAGEGLAFTWPAGREVMPRTVTIDHVIADERLAVASTATAIVPGSDHRAVVADLRLPAG
jgi:endonuclease/exonuclease/phosphatase (EEP) superfamily protein YafD